MNSGHAKPRFAKRPADPERWIRSTEASSRSSEASIHTARLTIDITPAMRGRIKIAAFQRGVTVAEMLRDLFAREFPSSEGEGE